MPAPIAKRYLAAEGAAPRRSAALPLDHWNWHRRHVLQKFSRSCKHQKRVKCVQGMSKYEADTYPMTVANSLMRNRAVLAIHTFATEILPLLA